jgi:hypothetical protein
VQLVISISCKQPDDIEVGIENSAEVDMAVADND